VVSTREVADSRSRPTHLALIHRDQVGEASQGQPACPDHHQGQSSGGDEHAAYEAPEQEQRDTCK
jgi:hypothetical protein